MVAASGRRSGLDRRAGSTQTGQLATGSLFQVPGFRYQVSGTRFQVLVLSKIESRKTHQRGTFLISKNTNGMVSGAARIIVSRPV